MIKAWIEPEVSEIDLDVGNLIWHIKPRPFWANNKLSGTESLDQRLFRMAYSVRAISADGRRFDLSTEEARLVIARLSPTQLIEFSTKFNRLEFPGTLFSFDIPSPFAPPHWKRKLSLEDKLSPDNREMIKRAMTFAKAELKDSTISKARSEQGLKVIFQGMEKVKSAEQLDQPKEKYAPSDLYPLKDDTDDEAPDELPVVKPARSFVLADVMTALHSAITSNILIFHGTWGENTIKIRYVGKREVIALHNLYRGVLERERRVCAMAIAGINDTWCISSTRLDPVAVELVESWTGPEVDDFYRVIMQVRDYATSLIPYIEAAPFTKILREFWETNKHKPMWWSEELSGVPGISTVPPLEHIDAFTLACQEEEDELQRLVDDENLALQVSGLSGELSQSIRRRTKEAHSIRTQHINYMLYNEIPQAIQEDPNNVVIPVENSQDDLVAHIEGMSQGKQDFHDLMLSIMRRRKEILSQAHPVTKALTSPAPASRASAFGGGSHFASTEEILAEQAESRSKKAAMDKETYEFSADVSSNIAKQRRRTLLLTGKDPYHKDDQGVDIGPADNIVRQKNF